MTDIAKHADRPVTIERHKGRDVVVKTYAEADASSIFESMNRLWAAPFGHAYRHMPEPIAQDGRSITMSFARGREIASRGDLGTIAEHLNEIAQLLARLHNSLVVVPTMRPASKLIRSVARKQADLSTLLADRYAEAVATLTAISRPREELVVSHGDFSPRNLMANEGALVLIDFDRLQMAGRGRDVCYLGAWCWVTTMQITDTGSWSLGDSFQAEYTKRSGQPVSDGETRFHRAAGLLRIAASWSALATRPDLARRVIDEAISVVNR
jgi:aminoglycoside phosphotransferase